MIVIDASSLTKYILHEENWRDIGLFIRERKPLYSIDHITKEVGNAIWKHSYLMKIIDMKKAEDLYSSLLRLFETKVIILESENEYLKDALKLSLENGITIYDSLYIIQAEKYGELLTSDKKQANIAGKLGIKVYFIP